MKNFMGRVKMHAYDQETRKVRITEEPPYSGIAGAKQEYCGAAQQKKIDPDFAFTTDDLRRIVIALDWSARNLKVFGFNLTEATAKEVTELARQLDAFWARYEGPFTDFVLVAKER